MVCEMQNRDPPKTSTSQSPKPVNVTLRGKKNFVDTVMGTDLEMKTLS